jgi:hypothetical protein
MFVGLLGVTGMSLREEFGRARTPGAPLVHYSFTDGLAAAKNVVAFRFPLDDNVYDDLPNS